MHASHTRMIFSDMHKNEVDGQRLFDLMPIRRAARDRMHQPCRLHHTQARTHKNTCLWIRTAYFLTLRARVHTQIQASSHGIVYSALYSCPLPVSLAGTGTKHLDRHAQALTAHGIGASRRSRARRRDAPYQALFAREKFFPAQGRPWFVRQFRNRLRNG